MENRILFAQTPEGKQIIAAICQSEEERSRSSHSVQERIPKQWRTYLDKHPEIVLDLIIEFINWTDEDFNRRHSENEINARFLLIGLSLANIRYAYERKDLWALRLHKAVCQCIEDTLDSTHNSYFWSVFFELCYEEHFSLPESIGVAYSNSKELNSPELEETAPLPGIEKIIDNLMQASPGMTVFDLANVFLSKTQLLPADHKASVVSGLITSSSELARDLALLFLLDANEAARQHIVSALLAACQKESNYLVTPAGMSRLITIRNWWPDGDCGLLDNIIADQRKKSASFLQLTPPKLLSIQATMIDGTGVQSIIFKFRISHGKYQLAGLLLKRGIGIRDAWVTPPELSQSDIDDLIMDTFCQGDTSTDSLRLVDLAYVTQVVSHFITVSHKNGEVPGPEVLRIAELLPVDATPWRRKSLQFDDELSLLLEADSTIVTEKFITASLKRSARWHDKKDFTESWFEMGEHVDKYVNKYIKISDGERWINRPKMRAAIFVGVLEPLRTQWKEHFILMALWAKVKSKKSERLWQDFTVLACLLSVGESFDEIPLMRNVCEITIDASLDTMVERNTHISVV